MWQAKGLQKLRAMKRKTGWWAQGHQKQEPPTGTAQSISCIPEGRQHSRDCKELSTRARGQPTLLTGDNDQSL